MLALTNVIPLLTYLSVFVTTDAKKNVLFLVADDMRPQLGAYFGPDFPSPVHPKMYTPYLDGLASRSLLLRRGHTQQALCSPSRTSLLTGRRPDTTRVWDLKTYWRTAAGNFTTIPQYFKENGYYTVGMGKIFHPGKHASGNDDPISWSVSYWHAPAQSGYWREFGRNHSWFSVTDDMKNEHGDLMDEQIAHRAVTTLQEIAKGNTNNDKPFFLAVGFHRPHLPFVVPKKFFDLYPESSIRLPENPYAPVNMPEAAWTDFGELRKYPDIAVFNNTGAINETFPDKVTLALRRAYYSAMSYTDYQIGRVLKELENLGLASNTVISFWGDHGWQLGEHAEWTKHTNFELSTHAPFMVSAPGLTDKGIQSEALTEFVDLFPTLVELTGLPNVPLCPKDSRKVQVCTEGISMVPLMKNPKEDWKPRVFSQYPREGTRVMGYTMRSDQYRYTEWVSFKGLMPNWDDVNGVELYDHAVDPEENHNRAGDADMKDKVKELSQQLHAGWRSALPPSHVFIPMNKQYTPNIDVL